MFGDVNVLTKVIRTQVIRNELLPETWNRQNYAPFSFRTNFTLPTRSTSVVEVGNRIINGHARIVKMHQNMVRVNRW